MGVVMTRLDPSRDREKSEHGFRNLGCWLGFWGECDETLLRQHTHLWGVRIFLGRSIKGAKEGHLVSGCL